VERFPGGANALAWSPSGQRLATAVPDGTIRIWLSHALAPGGGRLDEWIERRIEQLGAPAWTAREAATRDLVLVGKAAKSALGAATRSADLEVALRAKHILGAIARGRPPDADAELLRRRLARTWVSDEGAAWSLVWSADGTRLFAGTSRGTVLAWDAGAEPTE
jgi:WD40 repeat protein